MSPQSDAAPTEQTLDDIWRGLLSAARLTRCYDKLTRFYGLARWAIRTMLALSAVGFLGAVSEAIPEDYRGPVAIVLLVFITLDLVTDFAEKRVSLGGIATGYAAIESEWRRLWSDALTRAIDEHQARERVTELMQGHARLDERADGAGVTTWDWLNKRCAREAYSLYDPTYKQLHA